MLRTIPNLSIAVINAAILVKDNLDTAASAVTGQLAETVGAILQALGGLL